MTVPGNPSADPKQDLRAMRILCIALMGGLTMFAVIVTGLMLTGTSFVTGIDIGMIEILFWAVFGVAFLALVFANGLYQRNIGEIKNSTAPLREKLNHYRSALILYMALCEAAGLFAVIVFFLSGKQLLLIVPGIMLLAMIARMPSTKKLIVELGLDWQQQQELE